MSKPVNPPVTTVWVDQVQLKTDANVFLPWAIAAVGSPTNFLMPENIKVILERWLPIFESLSDSDPLRESVAAWVNSKTGAQPPP
jgi:hypothetical protein